jgi:exodeoxyribonuclease VII large subunit
MNAKVYTVTEINDSVKQLLKDKFKKQIIIEGEVSNCKLSGKNLYFNIKDRTASIFCVFWRFKNDIDIKDGKKVKVYGYIDFYTKSGSYQFKTSFIEYSGIGDIHAYYEKVKKKYEQKGYFKDTIKKELPIDIKKIGILTSKTGAALHDVLYVLKRLKFNGYICIKNCLVQGKDSSNSIKTGIDILSKLGLDVILLTRGGGSYEDLISFSDPIVIEAIFKCKTCIISAVGHEVDFMLSDYVADIRAPTPSVAGELIASHQKNLSDELENLSVFINQTLKYDLLSEIYRYENQIANIKTKIKKGDMIISEFMTNINSMFHNMHHSLNKDIFYMDGLINKAKIKLVNNDPDLLLKNGNIIVTDRNNNIIKNIFNINNKEKLKIRFMDGILDVIVEKKWKTQ